MQNRTFSTIRRQLGKTQIEMARLLGVSLKAVQSFEQGWRNVPVHTERQVLFLLFLKKSHPKKQRPCWVTRHCPREMRLHCPAWEFQAGHLCWFINGTICQGHAQRSWTRKMNMCRRCDVFRTMFSESLLERNG